MQASRHVLRFSGTLHGFEEARETFHRLLDIGCVKGRPRLNVELAFEEIGTNIIRHGAPSEDIQVAVVFDHDEVILTFEDDGVPFDPSDQPAPSTPSSLDDAQVGGWGVMLVKKFSTRMEYERTPQQHNRLTLAIATR